MKKLLLLTAIFSVAFMGNMNATVRERSELPKNPVFTKHDIKGDIVVNGKTFHVVAPPARENKITTRATSSPVITTAPGELNYYCKDVVGYGLGTPIQGYAIASYINWDGNDAYFYDIITAAPMGTYVKATKENGKLVLPMNQTVLDFEDEDYTLNLGLLRPIFTVDNDSPDKDVYVWFEYSDDYDSVVYSIEKNGTLILESPEAKYESEGHGPSYYNFPDYVIGYYYSDDHVWSGYCDVYQAYDEFNFERVEMPENLEMHTLTYINSAGMGVIVSLGETEDALYLKGLSAYAPDAVVKADKLDNGNKISIAPNQFIGVEAEVYFIITSTAFLDRNGQLDIVEDGTPVYMNVERDSTGKILSISADDSKYFLAFNDDPFYFYPLDIFMDLKLTLQETFEGIPSTPYDAYYEDYSTLMGANFIFFRLSSFANNGDIIDINNLYYSVYINGEAVEFEEENSFDLLGEETTIYYGMKKATTLVPYTFANDRDLYEDSGGTFVVGLYAEGIDTVGVQAVYICGDTTTYSGLLTIDTATGQQTITGGTEAGVNMVISGEEISTEYYDLNGMKVKNPEKGIYVKVTKGSDGKIRAKKVAY